MLKNTKKVQKKEYTNKELLILLLWIILIGTCAIRGGLLYLYDIIKFINDHV